MKARKLLAAAILLLSHAALADGNPEPSACSDLVRASEGEFRLRTANQPPAEQVATYLCVVRKTHPPRIGLARVLAERGESVARAVLGAIESEENRLSMPQLLLVLVAMKRAGTYDISADRRLMDDLRMQVELIEELASAVRSNFRDLEP